MDLGQQDEQLKQPLAPQQQRYMEDRGSPVDDNANIGGGGGGPKGETMKRTSAAAFAAQSRWKQLRLAALTRGPGGPKHRPTTGITSVNAESISLDPISDIDANETSANRRGFDIDGDPSAVFVVPRFHQGHSAPSLRDRAVHFCYIRTRLAIVMDVALALISIASCAFVIVNMYTGATFFNSLVVVTFDSIVSAYFLCDYTTRVFLASNRYRYVVSPLAVVELISIFPIAVEVIAASSVDDTQLLIAVTRCMQAVRILRLFLGGSFSLSRRGNRDIFPYFGRAFGVPARDSGPVRGRFQIFRVRSENILVGELV